MPSVGGLLSGPELAGTGQEPCRQVSSHSRTLCPPHPTKITHKHCKDKHSLGEITQLHPG